MAEGERHNAEREALAIPEIDESYLGDISAQLFDLQAERARLEGDGASVKELKAVKKEIASLQAFVDEHEADYARMEMRAEEAREAEVIPLTRKKDKAKTTVEAPQSISADIQDLQKHYDLTAEQLSSETDPKAHAALESSIDNLRERIHTLKGDIPWEKEDRVLAKGGIKRSSTARLEERADAEKRFNAAEIDRAGLIHLRNTYSQSLESGSLPKGGEILLRGAVQTLDDALAKYGRGDMSADAFQSRVSEISKLRNIWERYVTDESVAEQRKQEKERAIAEKTRELFERTKTAITHAEAEARRKTEEAEKAPFRQQGKANGVDYAVGWVGGQEKRYEAFFPQVKYGTPEAKKYNINDQVFVIGSTDKAHAKEVFDKIGEILKKEKNPYRAYAKAWAFESDVAWEEPGAQEFRDMVEKAKEKRDASRAEVRGILEGLAKEREDADFAPPPENLPVAPELTLEQQQLARVETMMTNRKRVHVLRSDGRIHDGIIASIDDGRVTVSVNDERQPKEWMTKSPTIAEFLRWQDMTPDERFRSDATAKVDELVQSSIERTNAKIDVLKAKIYAEKERMRIERNELQPGVEERFFAQGENPEELAKREEAIDRYAGQEMTPDQAVAANEKIKAQSARDFENEVDFSAAFIRAAAKDDTHRVDPAYTKTFAKEYWRLLMKENARLAEAMKPQPKPSFFGRVRNLFSRGPKPQEFMNPQELVQFQKMDKMVREIMETPATGMRAEAFRSGVGKSNNSSIGIGRGYPPH